MNDLTIVIPIRSMAGKLNHLASAISDALSANLKVVMVHDWADTLTENELLFLEKKINNENLTLISGHFDSPGFARNEGVKLVSTKWLTFWDADDMPSVPNLLKLLGKVKLADADVGLGAYVNMFHGNTELEINHTPKPNEIQMIATTLGIWRMIFRSRIVAENPFTNYLLAEDQTFLSDIRIATRRVVCSEVVIYRYISKNPSSLTGNNRKIDDLVKSTKHILTNIRYSKDKAQNEFDWILVGLQAFSLLKFGSIENRLYAIPLLMRFFYRAPISSKKIIIKRILRIGRI